MGCVVYGGGACPPPPPTTVVLVPSTIPAVHHHHLNDTGLPFTGGDVLGLGLLGFGAIIVGSFLARTRRAAV